MVHKYLFLRGNTYYFRWKVPADLQPVLGVIEIKHSLRTSDLSLAVSRAGRFVYEVDAIQREKRAYSPLRVDADILIARVRRFRSNVMKMNMSRSNNLSMGLMQCGDVIFNYDGDMEKELAAVKEYKALGLATGGGQLESTNLASDILFSELYDLFLANKKKKNKLSEKMQKEYGRYYKAIIEIMGDKSVNAINRRMIRDAILTYACLPRKNMKLYRNVPVMELLEMDIPKEHLIAGKTAEQVRKLVQGIFKYAVQEEIITESPARDLELNLKTTRTYAQYTDKEVRSILEATFEESTLWKKWLPMLAAYMGARRTELVQLRKQDIKRDSNSGRYYVLITDKAGNIKTESGIRQVPLHSELMESGFIKFVNGIDEEGDRLFDGLKPQAVTSWFGRLRERLNIDKFDDFGNRKVFHSFRHTFVTKSRTKKNPVEHVQQVVGHKKLKAGVTDVYSHIMPIGSVLGVVDKISYN